MVINGRYSLMKNLIKSLAFFVCFVLLSYAAGYAEDGIYFYEKQTFGSEAFYNPFNLSVAYSLDTVQLSQNFDTSDFDDRWDTVMHNLGNSSGAINKEGGFNRFVNRQIFPVDREYSNESFALIPNYFLHLIGGGMVYRKDAEYFKSHGYRYPRLSAAALAMTAEIIQEVVEKKSTTSDDEVADVLLFRPLGILLFTNDTVAEFVADKLQPAIWPHLNMYDINEKKIMNAGINYVIRPSGLAWENVRFFSFIGLNNLLGFSHRTGGNTWFSWAAGMATEKIDLDLDIAAELRPSGGLFYEKNNSLLWSVIYNGTENLKIRVNIYPLQQKPFNNVGFYSGLSDDNEFSAGIMFNFPVGAGSS